MTDEQIREELNKAMADLHAAAQRAHAAKQELFDMVRLMGLTTAGDTVDDCSWKELTASIKHGISLLTSSLQRERRSVIPRQPAGPCCHIQEAKEKEQVMLRVQFPKADEICRLVRYDFDGMENSYNAALCQEEIGVFGPGDGLTAHGKASNYLREMLPVRPYLGWDGVVYPRFEVKSIRLR